MLPPTKLGFYCKEKNKKKWITLDGQLEIYFTIETKTAYHGNIKEGHLNQPGKYDVGVDLNFSPKIALKLITLPRLPYTC